MKTGFDSGAYKESQKSEILKRLSQSGGKLYLEFGGKLFGDRHAARVLPGFDANLKATMLRELKDVAEVVLTIGAPALEENRLRGESEFSYGDELIRMAARLRERGILVSSIVINLYDGQRAADAFKNRLERAGETVYLFGLTKGYPDDLATLVSEDGYGAQPYIATSRPLVAVISSAPESGKLAVCLTQLYHEHKRGLKSGYAKLETFPVPGLPLGHVLNRAFDAANADLRDRAVIDSFYKEAYGADAVSYSRDVETFPLLKNILSRISGEETIFKSPTDYTINGVFKAITDLKVIEEAARQEIIRRYFVAFVLYKKGRITLDAAHRVGDIMTDLGLLQTDRRVVKPARDKAVACGAPAIALELPDHTIITGRENATIGAAVSVVMNSIKRLAGIDDRIKLIAPLAIATVQHLKVEKLKSEDPKLNLKEALIALSFSSTTNPTVEIALAGLNQLQGCNAHSTALLSDEDFEVFKSLGVNVTCDTDEKAD